MTHVVLDSCVFMASVLPEPLSAHAKVWLTDREANGTTFHAPILYRYEVISVTRKAVHQQRIHAERAEAVYERISTYPITFHFDDALLRRAFELAASLRQPSAYDAQYLALAERLNCEFWTADERLFNSVQSAFPQIRWLGNVQLSA